MTEEVLLEIIDEMNGLVEEFLILTTVHQNSLSTKHLRHLGKDAGSALSNQPVREFTNERVGSDTTEAVRATTLQTYAKLAYRYLLTLILLSLSIEITENLHSLFDLITLNLLCYQELDAILIVIAQHLHEVVRLIVLTTQ